MFTSVCAKLFMCVCEWLCVEAGEHVEMSFLGVLHLCGPTQNKEGSDPYMVSSDLQLCRGTHATLPLTYPSRHNDT